MPLCRQLPLLLLPQTQMPFYTFAMVTFATLYTIATMRNAMMSFAFMRQMPFRDKCHSRTNATLGQIHFWGKDNREYMILTSMMGNIGPGHIESII